MEDDDGEEEQSGGIPTELILSYLAFAKQALKKRIVLETTIFVVVTTITVVVAIILPRTYHSESRLMAQRSDVLATRGDSIGDALRGAPDVVLSRENMEKIVKQLDLVRIWDERRPPVLKLKDTIMTKLRGPLSAKDQADGLVGLMKDKLTVTVGNGDGTLTLAADWADPESAAKIVEAAEQNFLESRHSAEISMIADYAAILEEHAADARKDVDNLAEQVRKARKEKIARVKEAIAKPEKDKDEAEGALSAPHYVPAARPVHTGGDADEETARLKTQLEAKQRAISDMESERRRRLLEQQARLADLETKFTEAHPSVLDAKQRILALSKEDPQVASARAEVAELEQDLKRRVSSSQATSGAGSTVLMHASGGLSRPPASETLPPEITDLLRDRDIIDPALAEQFDSALRKYRALRDQISSAQIDLDTAQLAFKHRYKIVAPAEAPTKPIKPKIPVILAGGIIGALLLAFAAAILAELRTDRIMQRWQGQQIALPVLADLRFPPGPSE